MPIEWKGTDLKDSCYTLSYVMEKEIGGGQEPYSRLKET